jgi:hypothetical protein
MKIRLGWRDKKFYSQQRTLQFALTEENDNRAAYLDLKLINRQGNTDIGVYRTATTTTTETTTTITPPPTTTTTATTTTITADSNK